MTQSVTGTWDALYAALQTLFPQTGTSTTLVSAGDPGEYQPDLIIAVMGVRAPITHPTLGTGRSEDERIQIDVVFSAYVHGGPEAQQPANQAAWTASDVLKAYFKTSPNERLGGACYRAFLAGRELVPSISWERADDMSDPVPAGRIADVTATVEAWIRT